MYYMHLQEADGLMLRHAIRYQSPIIFFFKVISDQFILRI
jgi:hypothetical protein